MADAVYSLLSELSDVDVPPVPADRSVLLYAGDRGVWIPASLGVAIGGDLTYTHTQAIPAASWTIVHNLGKYPSITVVDSAGTRVFGDEVQVDLNTLRLDFGAAFSGRAFLN